ncbi:MAG: hypothetical protein IAB19_09735 [Proteobacteria bacterium]|uniref:Uncharacterized protein n=1 Tax=Candidatus Avisuccinivibrio stercorigallinarum TaxID=2840704 RepID=A0A9D9GU53_9GAMM|nr:hypothetical protein [Candidatus Avisuccinivibrio stercorigallinarum]
MIFKKLLTSITLVAILICTGCTDDTLQTVKSAKLSYNPDVTVEQALNNYKGFSADSIKWEGKDGTASFSSEDSTFLEGINKIKSFIPENKVDAEKLKVFDLKSANVYIKFTVDSNKKVEVTNCDLELVWNDGVKRLYPAGKEEPVFKTRLTDYFNNKPAFDDVINVGDLPPIGYFMMFGVMYQIMDALYYDKDVDNIFNFN